VKIADTCSVHFAKERSNRPAFNRKRLRVQSVGVTGPGLWVSPGNRCSFTTAAKIADTFLLGRSVTSDIVTHDKHRFCAELPTGSQSAPVWFWGDADTADEGESQTRENRTAESTRRVGDASGEQFYRSSRRFRNSASVVRRTALLRGSHCRLSVASVVSNP
jgi:hypothetical protein